MTIPKPEGPLVDAARMLRRAANQLEKAAQLDAAATIETASIVKNEMRRLARDAHHNIYAALARSISYE